MFIYCLFCPPVLCLHKARLLEEVGVLRVVILMVMPKKAEGCIWMLCSF